MQEFLQIAPAGEVKGNQNIPHAGRFRTQAVRMRQKLRKQLAAFLKKTRGELTFVQFEKRMGISASTLHRIELCDQNVTLDMLEAITGRLKISISDIFGEQKR